LTIELRTFGTDRVKEGKGNIGKHKERKEEKRE